MAQDISIKPVSTAQELNAFIKLPWKIYQDDDCWVPPLIFDVKGRLGKKSNPYFDHAEAEYFLATRGSEPVGRITAQIDQHYDKHWGGKTGHFGWFESIDDPAVAKALFDTAADWLRKKGRDKMQGPYCFNINDECGLLIDGFDTPPMFLNPHTAKFYPPFFDEYGFYKAQDLYAYRMDATAEVPEGVAKFAEAIRARDDVVIRTWNLKDFKAEMARFRDIYNSAWEKNWGDVMLTERELMAHAGELRYLVDARLCYFAETKDGEPMGASLTLPNLNEYIKHLNGHLYNLLPARWYKMVVKKKYRSCRVFALGVKEKFRKVGVGAVFYYDTLMTAKRLGYEWGEMSWILESNDAMNRAIKNMGGEIYKTYRIYEIEL